MAKGEGREGRRDRFAHLPGFEKRLGSREEQRGVKLDITHVEDEFLRPGDEGEGRREGRGRRGKGSSLADYLERRVFPSFLSFLDDDF